MTSLVFRSKMVVTSRVFRMHACSRLFFHEMREQVDWQGKNNRRVLLGADARQCLQITKLEKKKKGEKRRKKWEEKDISGKHGQFSQ